MAMCAGVQNVSRPMELCQEMSQCAPIMAEVTASAEHQMYQGTDSWTRARCTTPAPSNVADAILLALAVGENFGDVVIQDEHNDHHQKNKSDLEDRFFYLHTQIAAGYHFDQQHQQRAAVKNGDRKQIENREIQADRRHKAEEDDRALTCRLA